MTSNKKLIVHIGYSKCGSTTIQDTLSANYSRLIEHKILFPKVLSASPAWLRFFWEKNLPVTYPKARIDAKFQSFSKAFREEVSKISADTVVLSDEGLISLSEESISEFKKFLEYEFPEFEINIVIIVREPVSFFTSRCQQFISDRYFDKVAIQDFLEGRPITNGESRADTLAMNPVSFYSKPIGAYDRIFIIVHILKFEEAINDNGGLTHFFLKSCGIDIILSDVRKNESRSDRAVELIAYINTRLPFSGNHHQNKFRSYGDTHALYSITGNKEIFPKVVD